MRAVLCTSGGLPGALVLERLRASKAVEVVGVVRSTRRGAWQLYRRSGLRYTAYLGIALLRPLSARGLPLLATRDVNDERGRGFVARLAPDLLVSAFFNQRIGGELAALARAAALNIHPSLLPAFRGVDPVFYARLRGAQPLGVTLHRLSAELDAGDIIAQERCEISPLHSVLAATAALYGRGAELLIASLDAIRAGAGTPQCGAGTYDSWPSPEAVAALRRSGVRLARWRDLLPRAL